MQTVLLAVLAASLAAGMITCLSAGSVFEKYLRYFCALLLCAVLLSPLAALRDGGLSFPDFWGKDDSVVSEKVPEQFLREFEQETEKAVAELLINEFSLAEDACRPIATAADQDGLPVLVQLELRLYTLRAAALTGKVRDRLEEACGCEVKIVEQIGL